MATIRDVAKLAGVSVATVSRVLNEKGYVHEDTVKQVKKAIEELQYKPNAVAKALFKKSSTMIALLVSDLQDPASLSLLTVIEEAAYKEGYQIVICNVKHKNGYMDVLEQNNIAGILMTRDVYEGLQKEIVSVPFAIIDSSEEKSSQYYNGAMRAVSLLEEKGCHFLAYIHEGSSHEAMEEHFTGFLDAVWEKNISYRIIEMYRRETNSEQIATEVLRKYPYIDGIVTCSDTAGIDFIRAAQKLHISIPERLQVIGLNGTVQGEWSTPSLTTIAQPITSIGEVAIHKLIAKIKKVEYNQDRTNLDFVLIKRESIK
ncbi:LacI family DNA-binding transcriptional regulator [Bacillus cereus group sp. BfR-BA-01380]|uniref:LacI family DNA-binding transcriptional regulator n=1 Tax=Bacillus cereus group sp. BfR-BA-01380 TaxID=2920324 RepID=UPI001F5A211F|nr:LacI family DNA-binding transcriptional regulator [Bacillus cereus group sp. BfR-BA-01380]